MNTYFTGGKNPDSQVRWKKVGSTEVPDFWSETAAQIIETKYFRKTGPGSKAKKETSFKQLLNRVLGAIEKTALQQKYFKSAIEAKNFALELRHLMIHQKAAFNSPVWFNVGLFESYGLNSKGEHWAFDFKAKKIKSVENAFARPQCSACFIQSVDDSLEGIFDLIKNEAKLFKYGSGTGTNFSSLRSKFDSIEVGGTSSGLISFLEVLDKGAGAIKSGGTTRRAAKMVLLDDTHPELLEFIKWKWDEEKKAQALIQAGYSSDFEGPAYKTVSGQNSNNSVRFSDAYMKALISDSEWSLKSTLDKKSIKTMKASEIWALLSRAAWSCADPGVQFSDTINRWHTCANTAPIRASNPCSEYLFLDDSACNLASINLVHYFDDHGNFKTEDFLHTVKVLFMAQEILVDYSSYPTERIAQNSHDYRPLGLGFANLGSAMMRLGLGYDSDEARQWTSIISSLMTSQAYLVSAEMAEKKGAFHGFKKNKSSMLKVILQHKKAADQLVVSDLLGELNQLQKKLWQKCYQMGKKFGYRNAQATVIAPTGTIGLMMDCDTFGIEPDFSLFKTKFLSGGGQLNLINNSIEKALTKLGWSQTDIKSTLEKMLKQKSLKNLIPKNCEKIFETANGEFRLSAQAHLEIMVAAQPFISGAISKTVNLPEKSTPQDIAEIYIQAWKKRLKSVAIYRDQSKGSQPLQTIECLDC